MTGSFDKAERKEISRVVAALFAFLLVNLALDVGGTDPRLKYANLKLLQNQQVLAEICKPGISGVVFLGSSVIEIPLALLDGRHYYWPTCKYAEKGLSEALHRHVDVHDLSVEAALISDQYLILRRLAREAHPPIVVMAVAPRDFYDTRWPKRSQTYMFRSLAGFDELSEWSKYLESWDDYVEFFLYRTVWLYRMKSFLTSSFDRYCLLFISIVLPGQPVKPLPQSDAGVLALSPADRVASSINEYRRCYSGIDSSANYAKQVEFLYRAVEVAKKNNLKLLLVNLPLCESNRQLLPPGFYELFRRDVARAADSANIPYLDLSRSDDFKEPEDFFDPAHLGASGGKTLMEKVQSAL